MAAPGACNAAAAAGVQGWPVWARARVAGAGAWRGRLVRRSGRELLVGGPHGRGTRLRPCELCNPARLKTQIPGVVQPGATLGLFTASPTSRATRWLRAGGAPCGRLARKPSSNQTASKAPKQSTETKLPNLSDRPPVILRSSVCHWSSDPVILSSFSDWLESSLWGPRAGADGSPQALTFPGLVGVSLWRPWWVVTPPLEPAHDRAC